MNLRGQLGDGGALGVGLLPGREFSELGKALQIEIGIGEIGFVLGLLGGGLIERRLERPRIDLDQGVAFLDELAFLEVDLVDLAVDPGADHDGVEALNGAEPGQVDRKVGLLDRSDFHGDGGAGGGALLSVSLCRLLFTLVFIPAVIAQSGERRGQ